MTDLTEQWKKGQLEAFRWYYVKFKTGEIDICWYTEWSNDELGTGGQYFDGVEDENITEVLAPVPSYDEWKAKLEENAQLKEYERIVTSYNMKPIDYDIACETVIKLLDDNKRLKHDVGNLGYKIKNQRHEIDNRLKEIEKLKELLKECRYEINPSYIEVIGGTKTFKNLVDKINEALK